MIIVLMGVSGVGKTSVGEALAQQLGWPFVDADTFHSPANVAKMSAGIPLDDADRVPWLKTLHEMVESWIVTGQSVVLACSALKEAYRRQLAVGPEVKLVFLRADLAVVSNHLAHRRGHFMNPALLQSQFESLESPIDAIIIDASKSIPENVADIRSALGLTGTTTPPVTKDEARSR